MLCVLKKFNFSLYPRFVDYFLPGENKLTITKITVPQTLVVFSELKEPAIDSHRIKFYFVRNVWRRREKLNV